MIIPQPRHLQQMVR